MADTVTTRYIYPPNWEEGDYPGASKGHKRYVIHLTCISDGSGETDVRKVDLSDFITPTGKAAERMVIERIDCIGYGFSYVLLEWDRAPHKTIAVMGDTYHLDFGNAGLVDNSDGGSGDLLLTTVGASSGDSYDVRIVFKVK